MPQSRFRSIIITNITPRAIFLSYDQSLLQF